MRGDASAALAELGAQYSDGADPMAIMRDLAEITHWISVVKITLMPRRSNRFTRRTRARRYFVRTIGDARSDAHVANVAKGIGKLRRPQIQ